jgi:hypothetical protein
VLQITIQLAQSTANRGRPRSASGMLKDIRRHLRWGEDVVGFFVHNISFDWVLLGDASSLICMAAARSRQATRPPSSPHLRLVAGGPPGARSGAASPENAKQ